MRQIEVINLETIIDVTAETSNVEILVQDYDSELAERFALEAQEAAIDADESADIATAQASIATAQAGIATTQAGIATTQAGNALTSANNAAASAQEAQDIVDSIITANLTEATSSVLTITGGTDAVLGTGTTIQVKQAGSSQSGFLSSTDWTTFNSKQNTINNPVTGTGASGQVAFWNGTSSQTGDNGLFWDNTNKRLGIGTNAPTTRLDVIGTHIGSIGLIRFRSSTTSEICAQTYYQSTAYRASTFVDISSNFNIWTRGSSSIIFATNDTLTEQARISSVGNLLLNTITDAGFRLDVNGSTRFNGLSTIQGTTASDSGQLGAELLTTGTGDASWTGTSFATGYTHVAGSTTTLTSTLAGVVNTFYQITYTVSGRTAGSFVIGFGGFTSVPLTATGAVGPQASTTGTLVITPTSDFNGTIVLSIRVITASSASVSFTNSSGTVTNQIRNNSLTSNTFIGLNSGQRNTTGASNSFFGSGSGQGNTTGNNNSFFGQLSGAANTTGGGNSFFGLSCGSANTTGANNSFYGAGTGQSNTTGGSNAFFGQASGLLNTTGNSNSFFGQGSGASNTTGGNNSFFGLNSGNANTTGTRNSFFGRDSGLNNTTGENNIFLGLESGRRIAAGGNLTISNTSIFIGVDTRAAADNQANQIAIGHASVGLGSNTTVLGNSSTTHGRWFGNLLVGTSTNAGFALDVNGTARVQGALTVVNGTPSSFSGTLNANGFLNVNGAAQSVAGLNTTRFCASTDAMIGIGAAPDASAVLELRGTTKGFLPPRMTTTQKNAIASPATGLVVYDNTLNKLSVFTGLVWETVTSL
jgi:hypothetical protein